MTTGDKGTWRNAAPAYAIDPARRAYLDLSASSCFWIS